MLTIYDNIPASAAGAVTLSPNGRETSLSLRANVWGTTEVTIQTYNANDTNPFKLWTIPSSPINQNIDINLGFIGAGLLVYFTVQNPALVTTELLVNAFVEGLLDAKETPVIKHV